MKRKILYLKLEMLLEEITAKMNQMKGYQSLYIHLTILGRAYWNNSNNKIKRVTKLITIPNGAKLINSSKILRTKKNLRLKKQS